jgi:hypothetical protein
MTPKAQPDQAALFFALDTWPLVRLNDTDVFCDYLQTTPGSVGEC